MKATPVTVVMSSSVSWRRTYRAAALVSSIQWRLKARHVHRGARQEGQLVGACIGRDAFRFQLGEHERVNRIRCALGISYRGNRWFRDRSKGPPVFLSGSEGVGFGREKSDRRN